MIWVLTLICTLFLGMVLLLELGRRIGLYRIRQDPEGAMKGISAVEGAVFGLLGLVIAFTFAGSLNRFDDRRHLITMETNNISTAWLRIDLIPQDAQPQMRAFFKSYVDSRLNTFRNVDDTALVNRSFRQTAMLQEAIWKLAVTSSRRPDAFVDAGKLLLPALNEMFDITTTRFVATQTHMPSIVYCLLYLMSLVSALLAGYGMSGSKSRNFLYMMIFAAIISVTVYVIIDFEYPRRGFFRVDYVDQVLIDLRKSMP